jgi:molecular chaperone HscB
MVNYFEFYQLPVSFHPDPATVKAKFYEMSRQYHPDRFVNATDEKRAEVLRMAALNNDAYKTLNNTEALTAYILRLNGLLEEEEKYALPQSFLMEMMDLNETVSDYETDAGNKALEEQALKALAGQLREWEEGMAPILQRFDNGEQTREILMLIKDSYFRKKYLLRIKERIDKFAAR